MNRPLTAIARRWPALLVATLAIAIPTGAAVGMNVAGGSIGIQAHGGKGAGIVSGSGLGPGIDAFSTNGPGVRAKSTNGIAVTGQV